MLNAITWHRRQVQAAPVDGWRVKGDTQARWDGRAAGMARAVGASAGAGVGHCQVDVRGLWARPGGDGRVLQARGRSGARAGSCTARTTGGKPDGERACGPVNAPADSRAAATGDGLAGGRLAGTCCRHADTAKRTVHVRGTGTARRWQDGRAGTCCRHDILQTRLKRRRTCGGRAQHGGRRDGRTGARCRHGILQTRLRGRCACGGRTRRGGRRDGQTGACCRQADTAKRTVGVRRASTAWR